MELKFTYYPSPLLKEKCTKIPESEYDFWFNVGESMKEMLHIKPGVGLAANQVGLNRCIAVIAFPDENGDFTDLKTILNPEITFESPETIIGEEGCLSYPDMYIDVKRPSEIIVRGVLEGKGHTTLRVTNFLARIFCHEINHLNGIAFFDSLTPIEKEMIKPMLDKIEKDEYNNNPETLEVCE